MGQICYDGGQLNLVACLLRGSLQITLEVPDNIGQQLQQFDDRLPEILDRALQELVPQENAMFRDEQHILEMLASQPRPEAIFALRPAPELQVRMSELLDRNKSGSLSRQDETELDRYFLLEHLVRGSDETRFQSPHQ
jgi:hypothetical protein